MDGVKNITPLTPKRARVGEGCLLSVSWNWEEFRKIPYNRVKGVENWSGRARVQMYALFCRSLKLGNYGTTLYLHSATRDGEGWNSLAATTRKRRWIRREFAPKFQLRPARPHRTADPTCRFTQYFGNPLWTFRAFWTPFEKFHRLSASRVFFSRLNPPHCPSDESPERQMGMHERHSAHPAPTVPFHFYSKCRRITEKKKCRKKRSNRPKTGAQRNREIRVEVSVETTAELTRNIEWIRMKRANPFPTLFSTCPTHINVQFLFILILLYIYFF